MAKAEASVEELVAMIERGNFASLRCSAALSGVQLACATCSNSLYRGYPLRRDFIVGD